MATKKTHLPRRLWFCNSSWLRAEISTDHRKEYTENIVCNQNDINRKKNHSQTEICMENPQLHAINCKNRVLPIHPGTDRQSNSDSINCFVWMVEAECTECAHPVYKCILEVCARLWWVAFCHALSLCVWSIASEEWNANKSAHRHKPNGRGMYRVNKTELDLPVARIVAALSQCFAVAFFLIGSRACVCVCGSKCRERGHNFLVI